MATTFHTNTTYSFDELNGALQDCTSYHLTKETDEDGEQAYALRDGCGDQDGDLFIDRYDVQAHITGNQDVFDALAQYNR